jgi:hypothetical protein
MFFEKGASYEKGVLLRWVIQSSERFTYTNVRADMSTILKRGTRNRDGDQGLPLRTSPNFSRAPGARGPRFISGKKSFPLQVLDKSENEERRPLIL